MINPGELCECTRKKERVSGRRMLSAEACPSPRKRRPIASTLISAYGNQILKIGLVFQLTVPRQKRTANTGGRGGGAWLPRWFNLRHVARPAGWSVTRPLSRTCNTAHISKYRGQSQFVFRAMPLSGRPTLLFSRPPNFNSCRYSKRCRSANLDRIEPIRFRHFHWFLEEDNSQKRYFFLFFLE